MKTTTLKSKLQNFGFCSEEIKMVYNFLHYSHLPSHHVKLIEIRGDEIIFYSDYEDEMMISTKVSRFDVDKYYL